MGKTFSMCGRNQQEDIDQESYHQEDTNQERHQPIEDIQLVDIHHEGNNEDEEGSLQEWEDEEVTRPKNIVDMDDRYYERYFKMMNMNEYFHYAESNDLPLLCQKAGVYTKCLMVSWRLNHPTPLYVINPLLVHYTNLEHLYLKKIYGLPTVHFNTMKTLFTNLKTAFLSQCGLDDRIGEWIHGATRLEALKLDGNQFEGRFLAQMEHLKNLKEVTLNNCQRMKTQCFVVFCMNRPGIKRLEIVNWKGLNQDAVNMIVKYLRELVALSIGNKHFEGKGTSIKFNNLADLPKLTKLECFCYDLQYASQFLWRLANQDRLRHLLVYMKENDDSFQALKRFSKLRVLEIYIGDYTLTSRLSRLSFLLNHLCCVDKLEQLQVFHARFDFSSICDLVINSPNLIWLNLAACTDIDDTVALLVQRYVTESPREKQLKFFVGKFSAVSSDVESGFRLRYPYNPELLILRQATTEECYRKYHGDVDPTTVTYTGIITDLSYMEYRMYMRDGDESWYQRAREVKEHRGDYIYEGLGMCPTEFEEYIEEEVAQ